MAGFSGVDPRLFCLGRTIASIGCPHFMHLKATLFPNASQSDPSPASSTKWKSVTLVIFCPLQFHRFGGALSVFLYHAAIHVPSVWDEQHGSP